ncbi:MAG: hypothetical protein J2P31_04590 [Blastocatellia bacterium]|nr:hypothetical protein [Blastocatellia bacterium]
MIAGRRRLARLEPSAQSRIALEAAVTPAFLGAVFLGGASYDRLLYGPAGICLRLHDLAAPSLILLLSVAAKVNLEAITIEFNLHRDRYRRGVNFDN